MRYPVLVLAGLALAACEMLPQRQEEVVIEPLRQAEFVQLVEAADCRVDPVDHAYLHDAGFSDPDIAAYGRALVNDGRAAFDQGGALLLRTETCA